VVLSQLYFWDMDELVVDCLWNNSSYRGSELSSIVKGIVGIFIGVKVCGLCKCSGVE
jgi:hypothetical protein